MRGHRAKLAQLRAGLGTGAGTVHAMDRIVDLDAAAAEIEQRRPDWLANSLQPGPTTWRESAGEWPYAIVPDRGEVRAPDSVGVFVKAQHRGEMEIVLFRGGWADVSIAVYDDERAPHLDTPEIRTPEAFDIALDEAIAELRRRLP
jgi:hypothetical protein